MLSQFGSRWVDIEAEHAATSSLQQLNRELAEQPEANHGD